MWNRTEVSHTAILGENSSSLQEIHPGNKLSCSRVLCGLLLYFSGAFFLFHIQVPLQNQNTSQYNCFNSEHFNTETRAGTLVHLVRHSISPVNEEGLQLATPKECGPCTAAVHFRNLRTAAHSLPAFSFQEPCFFQSFACVLPLRSFSFGTRSGFVP